MRIIASLGLTFLAAVVFAAPPPLELFVKPSKYTDVQISPSGDYVAASLINEETGDGSFRVVRRSNGEVMVSFAMGEDKRVNNFNWVQDHMVLVSPAYRVPGEDFFYPSYQLMSVNVRSKDTRDLPSASVTSVWHKDPKNVLVQTMEGRHLEIHKMDLKSGRKVRLARAAVTFSLDGEFIPPFVLDRDGSVPFSLGMNDEMDNEVYYRKGRGDWNLVSTIPWGAKGWYPIAWGFRPGTFLTVDHRRADTRGIGVYDPKSGEHKVLLRHPTADPAGVETDFEGNVYAIGYEFHHPSMQYLNNKHPLSQLHAALKKQFPEKRIRFTSTSRDHKLVVAEMTSDRDPGDFMVVDATSGSADLVGTRRPDLSRELLANVHPFQLQTRDGATIYGYITMHPDTPLPGPMVVKIHGGPYGQRHYWGYNADNQILATRGYHVLEVNFRGSGGYGKDYEAAGYGEWGGLMQDDVTDATRWAIEENLAVPGKICAMGTSYGAYSAMMGAAKEPDLYKCVVGVSGLYDISIWERVGDTRRVNRGVVYLHRMFGDKKDDRLAVSPTTHAHKIKAAVMLVHGGQDRRTPPAHAHRMREALEDAGNQIEWYFDPGQGHGFVGEKTRLELWKRQLAFLDDQIGVGSEQGE